MNANSHRHTSILFCFSLWWAFAGASPALAATRVAASCDQKDVQAAIDTAFSGDTVLIPPGSCVWSSRLSITKYLIVKAHDSTVVAAYRDKNGTLQKVLIPLAEALQSGPSAPTNPST